MAFIFTYVEHLDLAGDFQTLLTDLRHHSFPIRPNTLKTDLLPSVSSKANPLVWLVTLTPIFSARSMVKRNVVV